MKRTATSTSSTLQTLESRNVARRYATRCAREVHCWSSRSFLPRYDHSLPQLGLQQPRPINNFLLETSRDNEHIQNASLITSVAADSTILSASESMWASPKRRASNTLVEVALKHWIYFIFLDHRTAPNWLYLMDSNASNLAIFTWKPSEGTCNILQRSSHSWEDIIIYYLHSWLTDSRPSLWDCDPLPLTCSLAGIGDRATGGLGLTSRYHHIISIIIASAWLYDIWYMS